MHLARPVGRALQRRLGQGRRHQLIGLRVHHEFETADMAAIPRVLARPVFGFTVANLVVADGTFPWHGGYSADALRVRAE
jgi:hypothetical protein